MRGYNISFLPSDICYYFPFSVLLTGAMSRFVSLEGIGPTWVIFFLEIDTGVLYSFLVLVRDCFLGASSSCLHYMQKTTKGLGLFLKMK